MEAEMWQIYWIYLSNMCSGGCTGGFRGNGLSTHQNPWLCVTFCIALSPKEMKWCVRLHETETD